MEKKDDKIKKIFARQILDSRGNPTVQVDMWTKDCFARENVPSGASTGTHEALELRDNGKQFHGKSVYKAVDNINKKIAPKLAGKNCTDQKMIDKIMMDLDGTPNKSALGANAIIGVSMANARLSSVVQNVPLYSVLGNNKKEKILPLPFMNIINGGRHAKNKLSFQEFMIVPVGKTFADSLRMGSEVYHELKTILNKDYSTNVGDEGGFAPDFDSVEQPFEFIAKAVDNLGYSKDVKFAIDIAASEFYDSKKSKYLVDGRSLSSGQLLDIYSGLIAKYPIVSIEDPFNEDAFDSFAEITQKFGKKIQIVGDDLTVTNTERIQRAIMSKSCNALLLKVNQIGSVTEAIEAADLAMINDWKVMVSHRSGETESSFIADLAVGLGCGQMKSGAPCRSERLAKYLRVMEIEEQLGKNAILGKL
jgi:enolase